MMIAGCAIVWSRSRNNYRETQNHTFAPMHHWRGQGVLCRSPLQLFNLGSEHTVGGAQKYEPRLLLQHFVLFFQLHYRTECTKACLMATCVWLGVTSLGAAEFNCIPEASSDDCRLYAIVWSRETLPGNSKPHLCFSFYTHSGCAAATLLQHCLS